MNAQRRILALASCLLATGAGVVATGAPASAHTLTPPGNLRVVDRTPTTIALD